MQFFRRFFDIHTELFPGSQNTIMNHMQSWGFRQYDGSDLTTDLYNFSQYNPYPKFKWQYDNSNQGYFQPTYWRYGIAANFSAGDIVYRTGAQSSTVSAVIPRSVTDGEDSYNSAYNQQAAIFFIPLKNKGFLLQHYTWGKEASGVSEYGATNIPKFSSWDQMCSYRRPTQAGWSTNPHPTWTMGLYNNLTNNFNYYHPIMDPLYQSSNGMIVDYKTMETHDVIQYDWDYHTYNLLRDDEGTFTDIKQNVCTLIKYPFQQGFLSNLFIATTVPVQGTDYTYTWYSTSKVANGLDHKFFSFGGRNFMGVFRNLVVELPSN